MQDDDLFEVIPPALDADPWDPPALKLRTDLLDQLRAGSVVPGHDDLSSALALTRLVRAELEAFGTGTHRPVPLLTARLRPGLRPRHSRPRGRKSGWVAIGSQASRSARHSGTTGPESEENGLRADHALVPQRAWTVAMRGVGSDLPGPPVRRPQMDGREDRPGRALYGLGSLRQPQRLQGVRRAGLRQRDETQVSVVHPVLMARPAAEATRSTARNHCGLRLSSNRAFRPKSDR